MNIVRRLFTPGAFGIPLERMGAITMLDFISEAWLKSTKEEIVRDAAVKGYELTAHVQIGDYDVALWRYKEDFYAVSINSGQLNPLNPDDQLSKPAPGPFPFKAVAEQLDTWINKYDEVVVGSFDVEKTKKYLGVLNRMGYRFAPFYGNDYRYGAIVSRKTIREDAEFLVDCLLDF